MHLASQSGQGAERGNPLEVPIRAFLINLVLARQVGVRDKTSQTAKEI